MNVIDILNKIGWDVLAFKDGIYTVQMTHERWNRERKKIEVKEMAYDEGYQPLTDTFDIYVDEVSFNQLGNLFVSFTEVGVTDGSFDGYEYKNMSYDELY